MLTGLSVARYTTHGGAVPIRVRGVGQVAVATVSGLPQAEDHALVHEAIEQVFGSAGNRPAAEGGPHRGSALPR